MDSGFEPTFFLVFGQLELTTYCDSITRILLGSVTACQCWRSGNISLRIFMPYLP